ncbi:MAG TPA: DUF1127 domain-containing protein [Falsiroseomonas sp.]|jgi:uncharacterized protein YjiS (DUF1127 family)|nr:DUF1127 domain-containing protein [Falsiroseomonas sp.]
MTTEHGLIRLVPLGSHGTRDPVAAPEPRTAGSARRRLVAPFAWLAGWLRDLRRHDRERHELLAMDDRELRDIGITHYEASRALGRPLWRR